MLLIQVKASKKGGIVAIDAAGEVYPCLDPDELWETLTDLSAKDPQGETPPVPEAVFLRVKVRRNTLVLLDPLTEMHHCENAHELWDTVADIIENDEAPQATAVSTRSHEDVMAHEDVQVVCEDPPPSYGPNEVRDVIEEMVGDAAADLGAGLFKRLRGLSHRGPAPKPGSRKPRVRVKRGDIY